MDNLKRLVEQINELEANHERLLLALSAARRELEKVKGERDEARFDRDAYRSHYERTTARAESAERRAEALEQATRAFYYALKNTSDRMPDFKLYVTDDLFDKHAEAIRSLTPTE